jgi:formylglycine-generating enzyme required for sulfatase activity
LQPPLSFTTAQPRPPITPRGMPDSAPAPAAPAGPAAAAGPPRTATTLPFEALYTRASRDQFAAALDASWALTEAVFERLDGDDLVASPDPRRRPLLFHYAHPAAVFASKLRKKALLARDQPPPDAATVAAFDHNELSADAARALFGACNGDGDAAASVAWPSRAATVAFRAAVRAHVADALSRMPHPTDVEVYEASPYWGVLMGVEHERLTLEASLTLLRALPPAHAARLQPEWWALAPSAAPTPGDAPPNALVPVPATAVGGLGAPCPPDVHADDPAHPHAHDDALIERVFLRADAVRAVAQRGMRPPVPVPPFTIGAHLVSNGEFWPFVAGGGYANAAWWGTPVSGGGTGRDWLAATRATRPRHWVLAEDCADGKCACGGGGAGSLPPPHELRLRTTFAVVPMPWDWPVEVTAHEAAAFLAWKTATTTATGTVGAAAEYRLPTEAEHCALLGGGSAGPRERGTATWSAALPVDACNLDFRRHHSPCAVNATGAVAAPGGGGAVFDARGNVWQWVADTACPLPAPTDYDGSAGGGACTSPTRPHYDLALIGGSWANTGDPVTSVRYHATARHGRSAACEPLGGFRYVVEAQ